MRGRVAAEREEVGYRFPFGEVGRGEKERENGRQGGREELVIINNAYKRCGRGESRHKTSRNITSAKPPPRLCRALVKINLTVVNWTNVLFLLPCSSSFLFFFKCPKFGALFPRLEPLFRSFEEDVDAKKLLDPVVATSISRTT